ncbi:YybH family protein [Bradyrhizobium sp. HKCCYLS20291]|uniref:YybH family protein n=1 Tax=Bradyrhizobium sp. HKCCYLS20291 TaxID=3420766 RepID=UPI003EB8A5BC
MSAGIKFTTSVAVVCMALASTARAEDAGATIRKDIDIYMQSIDAADPDMATKVWSTTPQVSFIHPLGHEKGWDSIKTNFYDKIMGGALKDRHLKLVGEPAIHVYGESAVVEFYWDFVATIKENGAALHTTGRETQVYENLAGLGWRIVHIHYSRPPATELSKGL